MLELDLILENFVKAHYSNLNEKQKTVFKSMLDHTDQELYHWFLGLEKPEQIAFQEIIRLHESHQNRRF